MLGDAGTLYAAEIHGIKIYFRWPHSQQPALETSTKAAARTTDTPRDASVAKAQCESPQQPRTPNARKRRSAKRQLEYMRQWELAHQQEGKATPHDEVASGGGAGTRESRVRNGAAGGPAAAKPTVAAGGDSQAAVPCGTARQQAMAGAPAKEELQTLPSADESSEEAQSTTDADDNMSEASAVTPMASRVPTPQPSSEVAKGRGRCPPPAWHREIITTKSGHMYIKGGTAFW